MSNGGGVVLHIYIFYIIYETFKKIDDIFFSNNHICKSDFMGLSLLLSFAILALLKPILLLLFTRSVRLDRTTFLLVRISRRLMNRIEILLFQWSLMRAVLVSPLVASRRTMSDNVSLIYRSCRFFKINIGNLRE